MLTTHKNTKLSEYTVQFENSFLANHDMEQLIWVAINTENAQDPMYYNFILFEGLWDYKSHRSLSQIHEECLSTSVRLNRI
jgi:hypothetical protein